MEKIAEKSYVVRLDALEVVITEGTPNLYCRLSEDAGQVFEIKHLIDTGWGVHLANQFLMMLCPERRTQIMFTATGGYTKYALMCETVRTIAGDREYTLHKQDKEGIEAYEIEPNYHD